MSGAPFFGVRPAGWMGEDPVAQARGILEWAVKAEELGFDVLFVGDRLLAEAHSKEGMAVYDAAMLDPFVMLTAVGARTTRLRLAPLVAVVPFRHPASLAKITASLDIVTGGRLILGAGSGWSHPELQMFGVDRRRRGAQMEEGLRFVKRLWAGETITEHGEFWHLDEVRVTPQPAQRPGPPIWLGSFVPDDAVTWAGSIGGAQARALARLGRIADGWVPLTYSAGHKRQLDSEQLSEGWQIIAEAASEAGREPESIEIIFAHWIAIVRNAAERSACEAGLARFFPGSYEEACATYLIGSPDEIAERIWTQTEGLERIDGYLFTPINDDEAQLEIIARELRPSLAQSRPSTDKQRSAHVHR
jgi:probable F420-dependent oxidoreductase